MVMLSKGGRPRKTGNAGEPVTTITLKELGLTKRESSEAQKLARFAEDRPDLWEALLAGDISRAAAFREWEGPQPKLPGDIRGLLFDCTQQRILCDGGRGLN